MVHFDASVFSGESPVYGRSGLVSFCFHGRDFDTEGLFIGDAPAQDSPGQNAELDLCHPFGKLRTGLSQLPCFGV